MDNPSAWKPNSRVEVYDYQPRPAFNGRRGILSSWHDHTEQWLVQLDNEVRKRLFKGSNLRLLDGGSDGANERPLASDEPQAALAAAIAEASAVAAEEPQHFPSSPKLELEPAPIAGLEEERAFGGRLFGHQGIKADIAEQPLPHQMFAPSTAWGYGTEEQSSELQPELCRQDDASTAGRSAFSGRSAASVRSTSTGVQGFSARSAETNAARVEAKPRTFKQLLLERREHRGEVQRGEAESLPHAHELAGAAEEQPSGFAESQCPSSSGDDQALKVKEAEGASSTVPDTETVQETESNSKIELQELPEPPDPGLISFTEAFGQLRPSKSPEREGWQASLLLRQEALEKHLESMDKKIADHDVLIGDLLLTSAGETGQNDECPVPNGDMPSAVQLAVQASEKVRERMTKLEEIVRDLCEATLSDRVDELELKTRTFAAQLKRVEARAKLPVQPSSAVAAGIGGEGGSRTQQQVALLGKEIERKLDVLKDYLSDEGLLSLSAYTGRLERQRFREVCQASGFKPEATLADVMSQDRVLAALCSLTGHSRQLLVVRAVCPDLEHNEKLLDIAARERLKDIFEAATIGQADLRELKDAVDLADAIGAEDMIARGRMFLRSAVLQQLQNTLENPGASVQELRKAIEAAEEAGLPEEDLEDARAQLAIMEKGKQVALRKLRAAAAWVNVTNTDKLKASISEAEQYGVDAKEIEKAKNVLAEVKQEAKQKEMDRSLDTALHEFLEAARPSWKSPELHAVRVKLARINILTLEHLASALGPTGGETLTHRLRAAGLKTFSTETLSAFEEELRRMQSRAS